MFTSRAEYRLLLREDNADERLTPAGRRMGLVDDARWARFEAKQAAVAGETARLAACRVLELLRRPDRSYADVVALPGVGDVGLDPEAAAQVEIRARYDGYIRRQGLEVERQRKAETTGLPGDLDYGSVRGLSHEVRQRLSEARPATLGQAARLPGVTPAAVSLLMVHLKRRGA